MGRSKVLSQWGTEMKLLLVAALSCGVALATIPTVAQAAPTGNGCAHIGTLGPGYDGQPAIECQRVNDPANPQQWVTIPDVVTGNPCPTDWLGHTHPAVGLKCVLVDGIPRWERS
ncbi:hypothetical protein GCM10023147_08300 [Tsukamurella soli]|uniref:Secreted protein n=1 Tax=Tsukamurella soli TaxID=644556 RepID=A0ABP8J6G9_9ACTN